MSSDCMRLKHGVLFHFHRLREEKEQAERAFAELEERFRPYRVSAHNNMFAHAGY